MTLTANMFGYQRVPTKAMPRRTNRTAKQSPNAAAALRVVLAAFRCNTSLLGFRHPNLRSD
jgi:hypothetical protein